MSGMNTGEKYNQYFIEKVQGAREAIKAKPIPITLLSDKKIAKWEIIEIEPTKAGYIRYFIEAHQGDVVKERKELGEKKAAAGIDLKVAEFSGGLEVKGEKSDKIDAFIRENHERFTFYFVVEAEPIYEKQQKLRKGVKKIKNVFSGEDYEEVTVVKEPLSFHLALRIYHEVPEEEAKIAALIQSKSGSLSAEQKEKVDIYFAAVKHNATLEEEARLLIDVSLQEITPDHSAEERHKILENTFEVLKTKTVRLVGVEGDFTGKKGSSGTIRVSSVSYKNPQSIYDEWMNLAQKARAADVNLANQLKEIEVYTAAEQAEAIKEAQARYKRLLDKAEADHQRLTELEKGETEAKKRMSERVAQAVGGKDNRKSLPEPEADRDPAPSASLVPVVAASASPKAKEAKEDQQGLRKGPVINKTEKCIEFTFQSRQQRKEYLTALRQEFKSQGIKEGEDDDRYQVHSDEESDLIVRVEAAPSILNKIEPFLSNKPVAEAEGERTMKLTFQSKEQKKGYIASLRQRLKSSGIKEGEDEDRYQIVPDDDSELIVRIEASQAVLDTINPLLLVPIQESSKKNQNLHLSILDS